MDRVKWDALTPYQKLVLKAYDKHLERDSSCLNLAQMAWKIFDDTGTTLSQISWDADPELAKR